MSATHSTLTSSLNTREKSPQGNIEKYRPDGTDLLKQKRPALYQQLTEQALLSQTIAPQMTTEQVTAKDEKTNQKSDNSIPQTANVAIFATYKTNEQALEDICFYIENNLSDIIQLPELFFIADKSILHNAEQLAHAESLSKQVIEQVSKTLRPFQYVCTSLVINKSHQAVIINQHGVYAAQPQLHFCERYQWTALGDKLNLIALPLEQGKITVVMLTADDANVPELIKIAALKNIHVLLIPFDIQEPCESEHRLLGYATEHRICIVAATREKSFYNDVTNSKDKKNTQKFTGLIANLTKKINQTTPIIKHQHGKITKAVIHPTIIQPKYDKL